MTRQERNRIDAAVVEKAALYVVDVALRAEHVTGETTTPGDLRRHVYSLIARGGNIGGVYVSADLAARVADSAVTHYRHMYADASFL